MDIQQLRLVDAVAKYLNFSLAADSCYISQSSLSQQIANLEKELGTRLFNRSTRQVSITEAGEAFLPEARDILQRVDSLEHTMSLYSSLLVGTLNIAAITSLECINFAGLAADFYSTYPSLTLNIDSGESLTILENLEKGNISVAFVALPAVGQYPQLSFTRLGQDEYDLVVSRSHPLARRKTVDIRELADERFIMHQDGQAAFVNCMEALGKAGIRPKIVCRISSTSVALSLIEAGIGIGFLPSHDLSHHRMTGVTTLKLKTPIIKPVVMVTNKNAKSSRLVSTFCEFTENWVRNRQGGR